MQKCRVKQCQKSTTTLLERRFLFYRILVRAKIDTSFLNAVNFMREIVKLVRAINFQRSHKPQKNKEERKKSQLRLLRHKNPSRPFLYRKNKHSSSCCQAEQDVNSISECPLRRSWRERHHFITATEYDFGWGLTAVVCGMCKRPS